MRWNRLGHLIVAGATAVVLAATPAASRPAAPRPPAVPWTTAWATAPAAAVGGIERGYAGFTFRNVVHPTAGGNRVRVHLSNRYGTRAVRMGHVTVAVSAHAGGTRDGAIDPSDGSAVPGTVRDVRFAGRRWITVPAGAEVVSDPVALGVAADRDLLVSIWTPEPSGTVTQHPAALQDSFLARGPADHAGDMAATAFTGTTRAWHYVSGVDVAGGPGTVVALGDSITDGTASTRGGNRRWTDHLAARLATSAVPDYGVANAGISGNRVLRDSSRGGRSALTRLPHDVLDRAGARTVIVAAGINDIQRARHSDDPEEIAAGLAQIAARARARGMRVVGATVLPWKGRGTWTPEREATRAAVNAWIRAGGGGAFTGVADFDAATRDPADPQRLWPGYDSGDHLHPNDAGQLAMARAVPLDEL
ncbi:SGNH/GDSL hydrolase family protein [Jidongwangia harbinensis]|uniref:SGNH/GDSL hydrolase family protein n=1 Tax=Jidongwangia harbinensis TaxID=2878561 RepID=UPI001CD9794D|nr:SGNH/GDSL hydrolase family protein [Jidongwangia harbinensis]MCA2218806.1 SGNH/GDSL hydrolase family protein [Jidongwangia harbinensis]